MLGWFPSRRFPRYDLSTRCPELKIACVWTGNGIRLLLVNTSVIYGPLVVTRESGLLMVLAVLFQRLGLNGMRRPVQQQQQLLSRFYCRRAGAVPIDLMRMNEKNQVQHEGGPSRRNRMVRCVSESPAWKRWTIRSREKTWAWPLAELLLSIAAHIEWEGWYTKNK